MGFETLSISTIEPSFDTNAASLPIIVAGVAETASGASRNSISTQSTTSVFGIEATLSLPV